MLGCKKSTIAVKACLLVVEGEGRSTFRTDENNLLLTEEKRWKHSQKNSTARKEKDGKSDNSHRESRFRRSLKGF